MRQNTDETPATTLDAAGWPSHRHATLRQLGRIAAALPLEARLEVEGVEHPARRALLAESFAVADIRERGGRMVARVRRRPCEVVPTVDYEVYEPPGARELPATPEIWNREVLAPTDRLLAISERHGARVTLMMELCQYWLLERAAPALGARVRDQVVDAAARGHDVQVHLHTRWLDMAGAMAEPGRLVRGPCDRLHELEPTTLHAVLMRARATLEAMLQPVCGDYQAVVFRAGKYQIQPHAATFAALAEAGYVADSSVWRGGVERRYEGRPGFDYRAAWHPWWPYWPLEDDINAPADTPGSILEVPILAGTAGTWNFDLGEAEPMLALHADTRGFGGPRVMIGHSKTFNPRCQAALDRVFGELRNDPAVRFVTFRDLASRWHDQLSAPGATAWQPAVAAGEVLRSTEAHRPRGSSAIGLNALAHEVAQRAHRLERPIRLLHLDCGTGEGLTFPLQAELTRQGIAHQLDAVDDHGPNIRHARAAALDGGPRFHLEPLCPASPGHDVILVELAAFLADPERCKALIARHRATESMIALWTGAATTFFGETLLRRAWRRMPRRLQQALAALLLRLRRRSRQAAAALLWTPRPPVDNLDLTRDRSPSQCLADASGHLASLGYDLTARKGNAAFAMDSATDAVGRHTVERA